MSRNHRYTFRRITRGGTCRWCGTVYSGPVCPVCSYR